MALAFDISAFEALFLMNYKGMVVSAYRITQDKDIAEDIALQVFSALWEERNYLQVNTSIKSYLFESTVDRSLNYIKKIKDLTSAKELISNPATAIFEPPASAAGFKESGRQLQDAISGLPILSRIVFVLSRYEHLKHQQIAARLGISVKTVEDQLGGAMKHLMKCFH